MLIVMDVSKSNLTLDTKSKEYVIKAWSLRKIYLLRKLKLVRYIKICGQLEQ